MELSVIRKVDSYKMFELEHITVNVTVENGKIKDIEVNDEELFYNEEIVNISIDFLKDKFFPNENEILQLDKMFLISLRNEERSKGDRFEAGRMLKNNLKVIVEREIYDLKEMVEAINDSKSRLS